LLGELRVDHRVVEELAALSCVWRGSRQPQVFLRHRAHGIALMEHRGFLSSEVHFLKSAFTPCLWNWLLPARLYTTARSVTSVAYLMPQRTTDGFWASTPSLSALRGVAKNWLRRRKIGFQLGFAEPPAFDSFRKIGFDLSI